MGLLLGASIVTIFEIIDFFIYNAVLRRGKAKQLKSAGTSMGRIYSPVILLNHCDVT